MSQDRLSGAAEDPQATVRVLNGHEGYVDHLAFSQDSRWLASGSRQDPVPRLWDLQEEDPGATEVVLRGSGSWSNRRMTTPWRGSWSVAWFDGEESLRFWDLTAGDPRATSGNLPWTEGTSISDDGRWLITIGSPKWYHEVQIRDLTARDPIAAVRILRDDHSIHGPAISPDGRWFAAGIDGRTVRLWDLTADDPVATSKELAGHEGRGVRLSFSPDSRWLATSGSGDDTLRLWDLADDDLSDATAILHGYAESIVFSPDGRWLLTRGEYKLQLWRISDHDRVPAPRELRVDINVSSGWYDEAFGPDSRWLVTRTLVTKLRSQPTYVVKLWDLSAENPEATGRVLRSGDGWSGGVIAYSPDGRWLVTDGAEGIALWDLNADDPWTPLRALRGHSALSAAFSPGSNWLATAGLDGTARLLDLSAPALAAVVLRGHKDSVRRVAFSSDGRWLCTGSDDGTIRLWATRVDALIDLAKRRAGRELTSQEAERYQVPPPVAASRARGSTSASPTLVAPSSDRTPREFPPPMDESATRVESWDAFVKDPYSHHAFASHMRLVGAASPPVIGWTITGVYRARRKSEEPLWVMELHNLVGGGLSPGCVVVMDSDGAHLRTILDERIDAPLVASYGDSKLIRDATKAKRVLDLPDFDGDSYAEIATSRWKPVGPGGSARRSRSIYLTDDDSIPCVFKIQFYERWPAADLPYGWLYLLDEARSDGVISLQTPIFTRRPTGRSARDESQPWRTLAFFTWDPDKRTYVGPMRGPNGVWEVLDPR